MREHRVAGTLPLIRNIRIIINPAAGKGESILRIIDASMKKLGIAWEASITHGAGDAIRYARAAVAEGIDALAVYGGDGTITEAITGLMGSAIPLAILPGGSANVLANELGIPADLHDACMLLSRGAYDTRPIDVGKVNRKCFVVRLSLGFEADVVKGADRRTKNWSGIFAYLFSAVAALKVTKKATYHLRIDGHQHTVQGFMCVVANTGNLGFSSISLDKHIDCGDGLLDVVVVRKANLKLVNLMLVTFLKRERPDNLELVEHWQGRKISVSSRPKQTVQCDGEISGTMPLRVRIIPAAIRIVCPRQDPK
jgi:diacylglycerol kinase (ATP)